MPPEQNRPPTGNSLAISVTPTLEERANDYNEKKADDASKEPTVREIIIDWDGPDDPNDPKNWPYRRKWAATIVVSSFTFISPISSSMVAPATERIAEQFGVTNMVIIALMTSVFVLGYAFGPLFIGPLSEIYGRSRVLQYANLFYFVWNLACGFARNEKELIAFRFLSGLGGSAPLAVGGGVLGDVWRPEERGKAIAVYSLAPLLGPVIGPICGAWIAQKSTWRWVFWSTCIVDAVIQVSGFFYLQETFAPLLLERKAKQIKKELGGDVEKGHMDVRTVFEKQGGRTPTEIFQKALIRPWQLFAHEQIIQLLGLYMAFVYGIFYLFVTGMSSIFQGVYHESTAISGLHYIALGVGLTGASQLNALTLDKIYIYFKNKNNGVGEPEFRLPTIVPGSILLPVGLLTAGWCAQTGVHWIGVDIGIVCIGAGLILAFQSIQTYVVDAFTLHAASALAAVSCLRSLAGFGFPLFAPVMYKALGYGKGNTILAVAGIVLGCPAPWLFWKYGKKIRMASRYAQKK